MSESSDLGVRHAGEQRQQRGEEVLVINQAVLTGAHQNPGELAQAGSETPQLRAGGAQRVVHCVLWGRREKRNI